MFSVLSVVCISAAFQSCKTPTPAILPQPTVMKNGIPRTAMIPKPVSLIPEGWIDVTSRVSGGGALYILVNEELHGTIILKELIQVNNGSISAAEAEEVLLGNVSIRSKITNGTTDKRITRTPSVSGSKNQYCLYLYEERGLLRRVLIFKKNSRIFEAELVQEELNAEFDILSADQQAFVDRFYSQK